MQHIAVIERIRAEPILNTVAMAEGQPMKVMGFTLIGPRRNRKVVECDDGGMVDFEAVKLWLDGVAYSTAQIARRMEAEARANNPHAYE